MDTTLELLVMGARGSGKTTLMAAMRHGAARAVGSGCADLLVTEEHYGDKTAAAHALRALDEGTGIAPTIADEEIALRVRATTTEVLLRGWDPPGLTLPRARKVGSARALLVCTRADDPAAFSLATALPPLLLSMASARAPFARVAIVATQIDRLTEDPEVAGAVDAPALVERLLGARVLGDLLTALPNTPVKAFAVSSWGYVEGVPLARTDGKPSFGADDPAESLHAWTPLGALEVLRFLALGE